MLKKVKEGKMEKSIGKVIVLVCSVVVAFFFTMILRLFIVEKVAMLLSTLTMLTTWTAAAVAVIFFFSKEEKLQQLNEKKEKIYLGVIKVFWALTNGFFFTLMITESSMSLWLKIFLLSVIWIQVICRLLIE